MNRRSAHEEIVGPWTDCGGLHVMGATRAFHGVLTVPFRRVLDCARRAEPEAGCQNTAGGVGDKLVLRAGENAARRNVNGNARVMNQYVNGARGDLHESWNGYGSVVPPTAGQVAGVGGVAGDGGHEQSHLEYALENGLRTGCAMREQHLDPSGYP